MSELLNELLNFFKSNAIAISALIISFFAFVMSFKSYRHGSRADLEIEVEVDLPPKTAFP